jgi:sugar (pentulose or hexulose) kinase
MPLGLGIDLGTTNTKVVLAELGRAAPRVRAAASAPTPEPGDLRATLHALLGRVLDGSAPPDAVGIASMAETGVPLGDDDAPLTATHIARGAGDIASAELEALLRGEHQDSYARGDLQMAALLHCLGHDADGATAIRDCLRRARSGWASLTGAELDVVRVIAAGATNRDAPPSSICRRTPTWRGTTTGKKLL